METSSLTKDIISEFKGEYFFLSNYADSEIYLDQIYFKNAEAAYQSRKCPTHIAMYDFAGLLPNEAKYLGKSILLRPDWDEIKLEEMKKIVAMKFEQNPKLKKRLIATGDKRLINNNTWHDNVWGNCTCEHCKNQEGQNLLGEILMSVRKNLR